MLQQIKHCFTVFVSSLAFGLQEKPEDVVRECSNCLKISPKYIKALSKRAKAYKSLGELEYAIQDITAAALLEDLANAENMQVEIF